MSVSHVPSNRDLAAVGSRLSQRIAEGQARSREPARIVWSAWQYVNGPWPDRERSRYVADFDRYPLEGDGRAPVSVTTTIAVGLRPA